MTAAPDTIALDHVQLAMPAGEEAAARGFFGGLLGLAELAKPDDLAGNGGCWFACGAQQLHLGVDPDFRAARKAHVALSVADLDAVRARLSQAGCPIKAAGPVDGRDRFFSEDPFGNRVEFIAAPTV